MKWKKIGILVSVIVGLVLLVNVIAIAFIEPWLKRKTEAALRRKFSNYQIQVGEVKILFLSWGVEFNEIIISPLEQTTVEYELKLDITSVKLTGIDFFSLLLNRNKIEVREVLLSNGNVTGKIHEPKDSSLVLISPSTVIIEKIKFHKISFKINHHSSPQLYSVQEGSFHLYHLKILPDDTIDFKQIKEFDFKVEVFQTVSRDSLYTLTALGIVYTSNDRKLTLENFIIHPNYKEYEFTLRKKYQTDCVRAILRKISLHHFSAEDFLQNNHLAGSFLEVEEMDMNVFRDRRKPFEHKIKPIFQALIYDYKARLWIDSVGLKKGNLTYTEHVAEAVKPGMVSFTGINAKLYNVINDTIFKKQRKFLELKGYTYLMGKGKLDLWLKAKLFDPRDAFTLTGRLSSMEASAINPMLEKNAFMYVTSGKVKSMSFTFNADRYKANGKLIMLYEGLDVAIKDKKTNDTTSFNAWITSLVANRMILDANPEEGKKIREGIIDYNRDPERFLFNYCFKSILSGLKSSISRSHKERKTQNTEYITRNRE